MSQATSLFPKNCADGGFVYGSDQGHPFVAGANQAGVALMFATVTQVGASPFTVDMATTPGLTPMFDASYSAHAQGSAAPAAAVNPATRTASTFQIVGGVNGDVFMVQVCGRLPSQLGPNGF